jgi:hypothetical protein
MDLQASTAESVTSQPFFRVGSMVACVGSEGDSASESVACTTPHDAKISHPPSSDSKIFDTSVQVIVSGRGPASSPDWIYDRT